MRRLRNSWFDAAICVRLSSMLRRFAVPLVAIAALFVLAVPAAAQTSPSAPGYGGGATVTSSDTTVTPGEPITLNGSGFVPNAKITLTFNSTPVPLGTAQANASGAFTKQVTVPNVPPGQHSITAVGSIAGRTAITEITVMGASAVAPPATPTPSHGGLAFTGTDAALTAGLGALLLVVGGLAVLATRKRRAAA